MELNVDKPSSVLRKVQVTIPATEVERAFEEVYREIGRAARVPGFRPGKAPRNIIERRYGSEVQSEVQSKLLGDSLPKAIEASDLMPVSRPKVLPGTLALGSDFSYTAEFEVQPEITLKQYKSLPFTDVRAEVTDADIDAEIETLRKQAAQLVPVLIRDTVAQGDVVLIDYDGTIDGQPFAGGEAEGAMIEIGAEGYLPGFAEGLLGAKVPSERTIPVTFPDGYEAKELAGKKAEFKVHVRELKVKELPAADDEFARDMGEESLTALRTKIGDQLRTRRENEAASARRHNILKALVDANPFDVPPSIVAAQSARLVASFAASMERAMGKKIDLSNEQLSSLQQSGLANAEFDVRAALLLMEVASAEKTEVTPAELEAEITKMAERAGPQAERLRAFYANEEQREGLRLRLLEDKTVKFLIDAAVPADKEKHS